jgi:uncharacterized protein
LADELIVSANLTGRDRALRRRLEEMLRRNSVVWEILTRAPRLQLPDWYLGAGCIAQTVWNELHDFPSNSNIKDYDLVYFDSSDLSCEAEESHARDARKLLSDLPAELDVANEARVHIWYPRSYGFAIKPYSSVEEGIASWPTTATAIGVKMELDGHLTTYSPYGLEDLFELIVRPNKRQITRAIYDWKVQRWSACWPKLIVKPWV